MDTNSLGTTSTTNLNSGVIEMRRLAAKSIPVAERYSIPTMDLLLSVGAPVSALGNPLAIEITRRKTQLPWRSGLGVLAAVIALVAARETWRVEVQVADPAPTVLVSAEPEKTVLEAAPPALQLAVIAPVEPSRPVTPAPRAERPTPRTAEPTPRVASNTSPSTSPPAAPSNASLEELMHRASATPAITPVVYAPAPASTNIGTTPSRDAVRSAMAAITPAVNACAEGSHGLATVTFVLDGATGRVRSAVVAGDYVGTPAGSCIARAVREVEVAPFSQPSFTIRYPFSF